MIDFLRATHAQTLALIIMLVLVTVAYFVSKKYVAADILTHIVKPIYYWVIGLILLGYFIFVVAFSSVNSTPRSKIDESVKQNREQYFEQNAKKTIENSKDTIKIK